MGSNLFCVIGEKMSRYRQTMREALEQVRQQFTEGHSDKDFKPYPDWKKTAGGRYPRFKHSQKGEIQVDRYGEWLHSDKSGKTIAFYRNHFPKTNTTGGTSMKLTDYLKKINEEVINESDAYDNNRYMMKKYGGQILARPDNSNTKDGKDHVYAPNAQIAKQLYKQGKKVYREESDHEVSMARGELEAIADKASQLAGALQGKSDEGNPLEAWVQSKITKAKDYINSVSDYLTYDPSMKQNEETLEEKFALYALRDFTDTRAPGGMRKKGDRASGPMTYTQAISKAKQMNAGSSVGGSKDVEVRPFKEELEESHGPKIFSNEKGNIEKVGDKFHVYKGKDKSIHDTLDDAKSALNEATYGWTLVSKAKDLAKKYANNYTKAVDEIEKLQKGLSKNPEVEKELLKYNEDTKGRPSP